MPRRKKERGRPTKPYPPRVDATPEEALQAMFNTPHGSTTDDSRESRCADCGREVYYPEILYRDGRCSDCHTAVKV